MRCSFVMALLAFASLGLCSANATPQVNRNKQLNLVISGYLDSPAKLVSGTNENFSVTASITGCTYTGNLKNWQDAWITSMTVKIGGEVVATYTKGTGVALATKTFNIRWATTQFAHGTSQAITAEVKWHLQNYKDATVPPDGLSNVELGLETGMPSEMHAMVTGEGSEIDQQEDPSAAVEASVSVSIYNVAGLLAAAYPTDIASSPKPAYSLAQISFLGTEDSRSSFGSKNHQVVPASGLQSSLTFASSLEAVLKESTVFNGYCHASEQYLCDSLFCPSLPASLNTANVKSFQNVQTLVVDNRVAPPVNLVVMSACHSIWSGYLDGPWAFEITSNDVDRAYVGFTYSVSAFVRNVATQEYARLSDFFAIVNQRLKNGDTIGEAIMAARQVYSIIWVGDIFGSENDGETPSIIGDSLTMIVNVYLTATERTGLTNQEINTWYRSL